MNLKNFRDFKNFKQQLKKLIAGEYDSSAENKTQHKTLDGLAEIKDAVSKLNKRQAEMSINIEEIQSLLEESHSSQFDILNAFISAMDYFDDLYTFAEKDKASPLFNQTEMMLNGIIKKASQAGITRIYDTGTAYDRSINTIEFTEENQELPDGHITKVLRCGYVYNGEIIRKSNVVVIKNHNEG